MVRVMANSAIIVRVVIKCKLISQMYYHHHYYYYYYYYYVLVRVHILPGAYYRIGASNEIYHPHKTTLSKTSGKSQVLKQFYINQNL